MKLTKLACVALSAALVFGVKSAAAGQDFAGVTTDYMKLQFNLTLASQNPDINNGKAIIWGYSKVKLTNKDILQMLADSIGTVWPAGAQLEFIFDGYRNEGEHYDQQLVVADRTGTNILYFAGDGENYFLTETYFDLDPFDTYGVYAGNRTVYGSPVGQESYGEIYFADFEFYADFNFNQETVVSNSKVASTSSGYWDLWGGGSTTETYGDKWTPTTDTGYDNISMALVGGGYYFDNDNNFISGTVLGVQQWNELNNRKSAGVVKAVGHKSAKH